MLDVPTPHDVRKARFENDITQSRLAEEAEISQAMLSRIEGDDVDPSLSTVRAIAESLEELA